MKECSEKVNSGEWGNGPPYQVDGAVWVFIPKVKLGQPPLPHRTAWEGTVHKFPLQGGVLLAPTNITCTNQGIYPGRLPPVTPKFMGGL